MNNYFYWPLMENAIKEEEINAVINLLKFSDKFTKGKRVEEFERKWSEWQGSKYSVFVNSGSSANLILIDALKEKYGWKKGSKIIVPAITWVTNISPIIQLGFEPVFVDVNFNTLSFKLDNLKEELKKNQDVVGIFITHLLGIPSEVEEIRMLCEDKNIKIFEDCCEATGTMIEGVKVGNFGEAGTFSFFFGHHMTTIEGGMISTNDEDLYKLLLLKRSHGLARELPKEDFNKFKNIYKNIDSKFLFLTKGYNVRNTEIAAVIGLEQLKKLNLILDKRNENFKKYYNICEKNSDKLYLIQKKGVSSFSFPFIFKDRKFLEKFKKILEEERIEYRPIISGNLLKQPFLSEYKDFLEKTPIASIIHENGLYLGNNQFIKKDRFEKLIKIFEKLRNE